MIVEASGDAAHVITPVVYKDAGHVGFWRVFARPTRETIFARITLTRDSNPYSTSSKGCRA
jgi:hypothetical protein